MSKRLPNQLAHCTMRAGGQQIRTQMVRRTVASCSAIVARHALPHAAVRRGRVITTIWPDAFPQQHKRARWLVCADGA